MNSIFVNTLIEWINEGDNRHIDRIIWISENGKDAVKINILNPKAFPEWTMIDNIEDAINNNLACKTKDDPFAFLQVINDEYVLKHSRHRDSAWAVIKDIVNLEPDIYYKHLRGGIIVQTAKKANVKKDTVYKYLRRYWIGGLTPNALLPAFFNSGGLGKQKKSNTGVKRGRPRKVLLVDSTHVGVNVDDEIKKIFRIAIEMFHNKSDCPTLQRTYEKMCQKFFNNGYYIRDGFRYSIIKDLRERPTITQFRYFYKTEFDIEKTITTREGRTEFETRYRALLGDTFSISFGPGSLWEIDATVVDVYLISIVNNRWIIGRPVLYIVIDSFSRCVEGLYVGLEGPSWIGAMMALENAMTDKVSYCAQYGVQISEDDWPCHQMPRAIIGDRGEMISRSSDNLPTSLNIGVYNTPPYRDDLKSIVERHFRIAKDTTIKWLPGAIKQRYRQRGEPDHRLDAILTINDFIEIMIRTILKHNNEWRLQYYPLNKHMVADGIKPIPRELRHWGIIKNNGILREQPAEIIRLGLMPKEMATVKAEGIQFNGAHYSSDRAVREQWFEKARAFGSYKVQVAYDPRWTEYIYIPYKNGGKFSFDKCRVLPKDTRYMGLRYEEVKDWIAIEDIERRLDENYKLQSKCNLITETEEIIKRAKKRRTDSAVELSASKKIEGIKSNKEREKAYLRKLEHWDIGKELDKHGKMGEVYPLKDNSEALNTRKESMIEILREARNNQWEG